MRILIADDEKIKRLTLAEDLEDQGYQVSTAADGAEALEMLQAEPFDVVVADLKMPRLDGLELLKHIKRGPLAEVEVIIMTAYGSIPLAVEAVKLGAFDFVTKPFRNEEILPLITLLARRKQPAPAPAAPPSGAVAASINQGIIGQSPAMCQTKRMIEICARSDSNVLLYGETGVGKDLVANVIHRNSLRHASSFIKVSCTLFPTQLIESELYGHEKGSFTGAEQQRLGRFDLAEGGTLYLDDVDDIPLEQQAKILRVIEEKVFERVGGSKPIKADVRIIASTKRNLMDKIAEGSFREDLYYRLDVLRVNIPPLRARADDLPLLAEHLLKQIAHDKPWRLDPEALALLKRHDWPGNVRELLHSLERAYLIGSGQVTAEVLAGQIRDPAQKRSLPSDGLHAVVEQTERELLRQALLSAGGNKTAAAAALGMKRSTFCDKLVKHGLD
jgi:DNA-binding NtrC family response regulator